MERALSLLVKTSKMTMVSVMVLMRRRELKMMVLVVVKLMKILQKSRRRLRGR